MRVKTLHDRLLDTARRAKFKVHIYGEAGSYELFALTREGDAEAPHAYLSAGIHGDEQAGSMALLDLLRTKRLPDALNLTLVPLINPLGLERRTRENADDIDLNRDYGPEPTAAESRFHKRWLADRRFDVGFCLHEDFEATGAYLYELKADEAPSHSRPILDAMAAHVGIDPAGEIDGMPAKNGLMHPPKEDFSPQSRDLPEALHLFYHHAPCCFTLETPSTRNIVERIEAQRAGILAGLKILESGGFQPLA